jgi:hypothetical protein
MSGTASGMTRACKNERSHKRRCSSHERRAFWLEQRGHEEGVIVELYCTNFTGLIVGRGT